MHPKGVILLYRSGFTRGHYSLPAIQGLCKVCRTLTRSQAINMLPQAGRVAVGCSYLMLRARPSVHQLGQSQTSLQSVLTGCPCPHSIRIIPDPLLSLFFYALMLPLSVHH